MTVNFAGHLYNDAGSAINGASVKLLETGTTTQEGSTVTTNSAGAWAFTEADQDRYDVEITSGLSVRRIRWDDQISLKELDVRNNSAAGTPAATFTNLTNNAANQVAVFSGANSTKADGDEIYLSFKLHDSAGNLDEFARMTVEATDVTTTTEDGQIRFGVIVAGTLTDVFTINSSTGGAATISYEVDSFTIKGGEGEAGVLYLFADQGDDAGDEWKVNIADGGVLTFGNDIASAGTYVTFLTLTPHATTASSTVAIVGDATVGDDLTLASDSSVLGFGADTDTTLTHTDGTGLTLNSTNKLTFGDTGTFIHQSSDGVLTITSDTTVDINGAVAFDGAITGATNITLSGELDAATLDISGNADIDGTTNLDAVDIDGNVQADGTITVGVNDTGYDVKFFGATSGNYMLWDENTDDLVIAGSSELYLYDAAGGEHIKSDGTDMTIYAGTDLYLTAGTDINIPTDVGLTFGNDGEKIEGDGTDLTISGNKINLTPTEDVFVANGTGLVIGHTAQITNSQLAELQVLGTGAADSMAILGRWSADTGAPELAFVKSRDPAIADGSFAKVSNADPVGQIRFYPDDGADFQTLAAQFRGVVDDASPAAGDIGMAFVWSQMPGGEGALAETMRLTAAGSLTFNQSSTISTSTGDLTLDPAGNDVILLDDTALAFGTGSDSKIYFDGTNTYWEPQAVGTGKLMIALGDSPPAPDADFHIWNGSAGSVDAVSSASLVIEDSANATINLLAPLNGEAGLWIGNSDSVVRGRFIYYGSGATPADTWQFHIVGSARLNYSIGAFAFQEETTISTTGGDLILDPAVNVKIGGTADHGTTVGTNVLSIFNGTAPVGTLANGISLYSTSGELFVMDAAANDTQLSPHDSEGNWVFNSKDVEGKRLVIHMEKFMRALEAHFGWGFIEEFIEEA